MKHTKLQKIMVVACLSLSTASAIAAHMPSPTMAKGDRVRVRGESGIEIDTTIAPDMTLQIGAAYVKDSSNDHYYYATQYNSRQKNEASIYLQAVIPITFGDRSKPDPSRLYDLELRSRTANIKKLEAEVLILRAAAASGQATSSDVLFIE